MHPASTSPIVAAYPLLSVEAVGILFAVYLHTEGTILALIEVNLAGITQSDMFGVLLASVIPYMPPTSRSIPGGSALAMGIAAKLP